MHTRIKQIRQYYNLSQKQFADTIGLKEITIASYEHQRRVPSAGTVNNICNTFHINKEWFTNGTGDMLMIEEPEAQQKYKEAIHVQAMQLAAQDDPMMKELVSFLWTLSEDEFFMLKNLVDKWKNRESVG